MDVLTTNDERANAQLFALNRARGHVHIELAAHEGVTRRQMVDESGSLRVRFPNPEGAWCEAMLVNNAGGIAGGDRFAVQLRLEENARLNLTTASAEKVYRSHGPFSDVDVRIDVAGGAALRWLPQETILFDQARMRRAFEINLALDAELVMAEMIVFGRHAMGEVVTGGAFVDRWRVRRNGQLIFADQIALGDNIQTMLAHKACGDRAVALATIVIVPGNDVIVEAMRAAMPVTESEFGVSAWNGLALARFCSNDAAAMRRDVVAALRCLVEKIPRAWIN